MCRLSLHKGEGDMPGDWFSVDGEFWSAPRHIPQRQAFDSTIAHFYEAPSGDPSYPEVFAYTDHITYAPGDEVVFHASTTISSIDIVVSRESTERVVVHQSGALQAGHHVTPETYYETGCGWPSVHRWRVPLDTPSGFYAVVTRGVGPKGEVREHEHGFVVRASSPGAQADILFVLPTSTWLAYSDWGGTNQYMGHFPHGPTGAAPIVSVQKPWAKGFMYLPEGAPRKKGETSRPPNGIPRYPILEFAFARGYSRFYGSSGWAHYDRHFAMWAERNGLKLDYATQVDLHFRPEILQHYKCVVTVGHDEYWSREMRDAIDAYDENGGHFARFAGNFAWQIRLEDEGRRQVCYKEIAHTHDPVRGTDRKDRLTSMWEDPVVDYPGSSTTGLNSLQGVYAAIGGLAARHSGGFTVYRPEHWAFGGTGLSYGDDFGSAASIFGYEVDGLHYEIRNGLPYPCEAVPEGLEILAMGLASNDEGPRTLKGSVRYYGTMTEQTYAGLAQARYGKTSAELADASRRGSGMIVSFKRGKGEVFNAGTCDWVYGLKLHDPFVELVTTNVLRRFCK
jgi:hypothetical protein